MNYNIDLREAMRRRAERVAPVPSDFAQQVAKKVRERRHKRAVRRWLWIGAAAAVAGIVVLIGSLPISVQKGEEVVAQVVVSHPAPANEQPSMSLEEEAQKGQHVSSTPEERPLTVKPIEKPLIAKPIEKTLTAHLPKPKSTDVPQRIEPTEEHSVEGSVAQVDLVQENLAQVSNAASSAQPGFTSRELELMRQAELKSAQATMYIEEAIRVSQLLGDEETPPTRSV